MIFSDDPDHFYKVTAVEIDNRQTVRKSRHFYGKNNLRERAKIPLKRYKRDCIHRSKK